MLAEISRELLNNIRQYSPVDDLIFNGKLIPLVSSNFQTISSSPKEARLAFIDGGQAEIISAGNFCLSFIRIAASIFTVGKQEAGKKEIIKKEFYLLTSARYFQEDLFYESKIFSNPLDNLIPEKDLFISSNDFSIKSGVERAPIVKVSSLARRLAELALATEVKADFIVLDGTLEKTFPLEDKYLEKLPSSVSALAKSSSLFTALGNSPVVLLNQLGPAGCWSYLVENKTYFVKLHPQAKYVFRFEGNPAVLPHLVRNSADALFLGYPYGLIFGDKMARVSNAEKNSLQANLLLRAENKEIVNYLNTTNAHALLDRSGFSKNEA